MGLGMWPSSQYGGIFLSSSLGRCWKGLLGDWDMSLWRVQDDGYWLDYFYQVSQSLFSARALWWANFCVLKAATLYRQIHQNTPLNARHLSSSLLYLPSCCANIDDHLWLPHPDHRQIHQSTSSNAHQLSSPLFYARPRVAQNLSA